MSLSGRVVKVLYVEDNEDIRRVFDALMSLIVSVETEVLLASDGQEGVELALREKPDIIFMDEELPLMDGVEATRRLRSDSSLSGVPVIMVSAHMDQRQRRERAEEAGVTRLIGKPFELEDLEDAVQPGDGVLDGFQTSQLLVGQCTPLDLDRRCLVLERLDELLDGHDPGGVRLDRLPILLRFGALLQEDLH